MRNLISYIILSSFILINLELYGCEFLAEIVNNEPNGSSSPAENVNNEPKGSNCPAGNVNSEPNGSNCPAGNGPNPAYCKKTSPISDLLCFLSGSTQPGQGPYVYIGFDDYLAAFCSMFYDCQSSQRAWLNIQDCYGYFFNLSSKFPNGTKIYELYYIDVTIPGCPQFQKLEFGQFSAGDISSQKALLHTPKPAGLSFTNYGELFEDRNLSCNTFASINVKGDCSDQANTYTCPVRSPYSLKQPMASLDFSHLKNVALYQETEENNQTLGGAVLVDENGLFATCALRPGNANENDGTNPFEVEYCTADCYDTTPYCIGMNPQCSVANIIESYGYNDHNTYGLNPRTASTIAKLYLEGLNNQPHCNYNPFTTLVNFAFLLPEDAPYNPQNLGIQKIFLRGICERKFKNDILRKLFDIV